MGSNKNNFKTHKILYIFFSLQKVSFSFSSYREYKVKLQIFNLAVNVFLVEISKQQRRK